MASQDNPSGTGLGRLNLPYFTADPMITYTIIDGWIRDITADASTVEPNGDFEPNLSAKTLCESPCVKASLAIDLRRRNTELDEEDIQAFHNDLVQFSECLGSASRDSDRQVPHHSQVLTDHHQSEPRYRDEFVSTKTISYRFEGHHITRKGYLPGDEGFTGRNMVITRGVTRTQTGHQLQFIKVSWDDRSREDCQPAPGHDFQVRRRTIDLRNSDEVPEQRSDGPVPSAGPSAPRE